MPGGSFEGASIERSRLSGAAPYRIRVRPSSSPFDPSFSDDNERTQTGKQSKHRRRLRNESSAEGVRAGEDVKAYRSRSRLASQDAEQEKAGRGTGIVRVREDGLRSIRKTSPGGIEP